MTTGEASVDHFVPKSAQPQLAYEWSNLRLAARRYNQLKGDYQDVLDPFQIAGDWFVLNIPSLQLSANDNLSDAEAGEVWCTISRLRLNDERALRSRARWLREYCNRHISFEFLQRHAPFITHELRRQGLVADIFEIFGQDALE